MVGKNSDKAVLELKVAIVNPSGSDKTDGVIKINVKGGKAPYYVTIQTNSRTSAIEFETDGYYELKNISKGFYFLFVRDGEGNHATQNINI